MGQKLKFQNHIGHLHDMLNQILEYNLATTEGVDGVQVTNNFSDEGMDGVTRVYPNFVKKLRV